MSNIQAAMGCAQLSRINTLVERKREIFTFYFDKLNNIPNITINPEPEGVVNGFWMPTIVFSEQSGITREKLQLAFSDQNIDARVFFHPLSQLPMFDDNKSNVHAWDIPKRAINLPSYHDMSLEDMERVCAVILNIGEAIE